MFEPIQLLIQNCSEKFYLKYFRNGGQPGYKKTEKKDKMMNDDEK